MTTINVKFHTSDLPAWAQNDPTIVERCRNDLAFRASVHAADTTQQRNQLRRDAQRLRKAVEDR
jgi:hypothetical protein